MKLMWTNTASLLIREGDTTLVFDPFLGMPPGHVPRAARRRMEDVYRRADAVLITHGHFDHIRHIPRIYRGIKVPVYCTKTPLNTLKKHRLPEEDLREIHPGDRLEIGPFEIRIHPSRHCRFDAGILLKTFLSFRFFRHALHMARLLLLHLSCREAGEILCYEVRCKEKTILILGSMNYRENISYPTGADCLVLPLQGRSDQDTYALRIPRAMKPKRILLDHYDDSFAPMTTPVDPSGYEKNCRDMGMDCERLIPWKIYRIEQSNL